MIRRPELAAVELWHVEPVDCLIRHFRGRLSSNPTEQVAVHPIQEFPTAGGHTNSAPNPMAMDPYEFERLVTELFAQMGLDAETTKASGDGGLDVVAHYRHEVLAFKVIRAAVQ